MAVTPRAVRATLLALAAAGLVTGVWAGLVRAGWVPASGGVVSPAAHGVLVVGGFFGALISLERAVALDRPWAYVAPPAAVLGAVGFGVGMPGAVWGSLLAAAILTAGSVVVWRRQPAAFTAVMAAGAVAWLVAVAVQLGGGSVDRQVPWLVGFLVGVIVGERLELARMSPPSRWKRPVFVVGVVVFGAGVVAASSGLGWRLFGAGLVALAGWLGWFDVARHTSRMGGVTGFIGVCLLSGYVWMAVAGVWWLAGGDLGGSLGWDGALHAVLVGFVLSMVFGHVHLVAPAVLGLTVPFRRWFWLHVWLLHGSLVLRVAGDLVGSAPFRRWGALGNALAIVVFLLGTVVAIRSGRTETRPIEVGV